MQWNGGEGSELGVARPAPRVAAQRYGWHNRDDLGLLAPELANGIARVKGVAAKVVRLRNWLTARQAQALLKAPDATTRKSLRDWQTTSRGIGKDLCETHELKRFANKAADL